jgi:hypothetical protein
MGTQELAKKIAKYYDLYPAEKYSLSYREFDNVVEVIGWVPDPVYDIRSFKKELIPMCWVTVGTFNANALAPKELCR